MGAKILVVDDEKKVTTFLSRVLGEIEGFFVEVAETAEEALQKIESVTFDLVLVGFKLPKGGSWGSGLEISFLFTSPSPSPYW